MMSNPEQLTSVMLGGDVMTGRGIDQALPHPADPVLYEPYVRDAREYVRLSEQIHGPIPRPMDFAYIWGDALEELQRAEIDVRIVNLETSVTSSDDAWSGKRIHYRMHPLNTGCLTAARFDCCCLANNHVMDWGHEGLTETLRSLDRAGLRRAGAGENEAEAVSPAAIDVPGKGRVLVFSMGSTTSGIPLEWGASQDHPGVNVLKDLSEETSQRVIRQIREAKRPGDVVVVSIHWGYDVPNEQIRFAHRLVEGGADVVHGHSSHHVKGIEVYRGRLILYGCGDLIDDYEGISGHEEFRGDLKLLFLAQIDPRLGQLRVLRPIPMQIRRFQLKRASLADTEWLRDRLNSLGAPFGTNVEKGSDNSLTLRWR